MVKKACRPCKLGLVLYSYVMDIDGCTLLDKNENVFTDLDTYEKFKETGCFFVIRKSFYKNSVVNNVAHWVASVQKFILPRFDFDTSTMQHKMISNHQYLCFGHIYQFVSMQTAVA